MRVRTEAASFLTTGLVSKVSGASKGISFSASFTSSSVGAGGGLYSQGIGILSTVVSDEGSLSRNWDITESALLTA